MEYVTFNQEFQNIPDQDIPIDNLVVCVEDEVLNDAWKVAKATIDGGLLAEERLGIFDEQQNAQIFAKAYCDFHNNFIG